MKYTAKIPFIDDMGSIQMLNVEETTYESKEENTLWQINSMRDHDGLSHLKELPFGVVFTPTEAQ